MTQSESHPSQRSQFQQPVTRESDMPLIVQSMPKEQVEKFGKQVPIQRPGLPDELAPAYMFLASNDSSYMAGQILRLNGGEVVNG